MVFSRLTLIQKVTIITTLGLLGGVVLSGPLWYAAARPSFPLLPLFGTAHPETAGWSWISAGSLVGTLLLSGLFPGKKVFPAVLLGCLAILCGLDLNRLQPWVWMEGLVLAALLGSQQEPDTRNTWCWIVAAVYAWSGFHKLTPYFAEDNFSWFCSAFAVTKPLGAYPGLGYAVAFMEMLLAFGLFWPRSRPVFRWLAVGFHGVIILTFSPLGLHWNTVVIPWNMTLAALVWFLFSDTDRIVLPKSNGLRSLIALAGLAPLLQFAGAWPESLSWKLYSNTQPEATFYAPANSFRRVPEQAAIWEENAFDAGTKLLLDDWATREIHTPMFSTDRTFRQTAVYLCGCTTQPDSAGLYILHVQAWNKRNEKWLKIPCRELLNAHE